ncbi:hypothetical protein G1H11_24345 [Phytoactinopolyspora alkaliphila]|uniref:Uncharacterized protein n=1 Tax=Phytoactinopolyspora alkaliphila TaxID=1783498 RepID=A0A6N9YTQ6_9ACTN|nr:hypothetical protein [Phytoactinopolyspora alkaliphila]NED98433.1 hypothetical protein [Phytoactinopolyspora alkaliphila]
MAQTLQEILLAPNRRPKVVEDVTKLVDSEVSDKSGVSGLAVKSGYALIKKINSSFVSDAVDSMLDNFVGRMEPYYASYKASGTGSFTEHLTANSSDVADALLGVTDDRAAGSRRDSVKKVYAKLRPQAKKHVEEALPRLGALVEEHAAAVNTG